MACRFEVLLPAAATADVAAARQAGPGRIAMVTQLETGSLGRLMDDWQKAVGGRARVAYEPFGDLFDIARSLA